MSERDMHCVQIAPNAVFPRRAHPDDAGLDLAPVEGALLQPGHSAKLRIGWAFAIPAGHVGIVCPRSSTKARDLWVDGKVDSGYVGEVHIMVTNVGHVAQLIESEKYLAQLVVVPMVAVVPVLKATLPESDRGIGAFGSSDRRPGNGG